MQAQAHLADWIETLPSQGRYTFTRTDAESATGASFVANQSALRRLKKKGRLVSPRRGFYVFVPPEHRAAGSPPASWFIDDLMRYCGCDYYVGLLTAAALYGASHQQPMVFQVLTDGLNGTMRAGRVTIQAIRSRSVGTMPVQRLRTETGSMVVSTPEATAFDLMRHPAAAGYWSNVGTVLAGLGRRLDREQIVRVAARGRLPEAQRLGYLLDLLGEVRLTSPLANWLATQRTTVVALRTDVDTAGLTVDGRWRVIPNEVVEPDL